MNVRSASEKHVRAVALTTVPVRRAPRVRRGMPQTHDAAHKVAAEPVRVTRPHYYLA
jgi:hypothetical protein